MASADRMRRITFSTKRIIRDSSAAGRKALDQVAKEMTDFVKSKIDTPGPPASLPGRPPHMRTGQLHDTFEVTRKGRELLARLKQYGVYLDGGTGRMAARPWFRKNIHDKRQKWEARLSSLLRKFRSQSR